MSAVALTIQGPWLAGALLTEVASISGVAYRKNVNQMLVMCIQFSGTPEYSECSFVS